jgi:hypothetical protein
LPFPEVFDLSLLVLAGIIPVASLLTMTLIVGGGADMEDSEMVLLKTAPLQQRYPAICHLNQSIPEWLIRVE